MLISCQIHQKTKHFKRIPLQKGLILVQSNQKSNIIRKKEKIISVQIHQKYEF